MGIVRWLGAAALLAALLAYPRIVDSYPLAVGIQLLLLAYLGIAWNLLAGAGQFSFGHAAFFGIGAYTSTILFVRAGITPWLGMVAAAGLAAAFALGIGTLSFRYGLRGPYFALATLAFAETLRILAINVDDALGITLTGGAQGILVPLRASDLAALSFTERAPYYYVALALLGIGLAVATFVARRRIGFLASAVRDDEQVAQALGVDVFRVKLALMTTSAALTALAGSFYAQFFAFIDPETVLGIPVTVNALLPAVIGGVGSVAGPLVGAIVITVLGETTRGAFRGISGAAPAVNAALLIVVLLVLPGGLVSLPRRLRTVVGAVRARAAAQGRV